MAVLKSFALLTLLAICGAEMHSKVEKMYMARKMSSDLAPEATGYIYRSDSNGPTSYIQLGGGAVHQHMNGYQAAPQQIPQNFATYGYVPLPKLYPAPVVSTYHHQPIVTVHGVPEKKQEEPEAPQEYEGESSGPENEDEEESFSDDDGQEYADKINYNYEAIAEEPHFTSESDHSDHHEVSDPHHEAYKHAAGKSFNQQGHSSHGNKGDKGYKSVSSFDKGQSGKHFKDGHKGHYSDASGHKSGHLDDASHYSQNHAASKGYKGGDFSEKKGHKKGSKTTGFHNVYHKDEYKKEHKFYDDADNSGRFQKHGKFGADHHSSEGGHVKGGKHDSAYHHDAYGKKGFTDKGHHQESDKGHASKAGEEKFYKNYSDYGKKGGSSDEKKYGHALQH